MNFLSHVCRRKAFEILRVWKVKIREFLLCLVYCAQISFVFFLGSVIFLGGYINCVYDVTVGYPDAIVQTELDLVKGKAPECVHFDIRRINISEVPRTSSEIASWINS